MDVPRLASTLPRARIEPDNIFVKDGKIYTTAGVTAGIDLSLAMIEDDFGRTMALDVEKYLIIYLRRAGGSPNSVLCLSHRPRQDRKRLCCSSTCWTTSTRVILWPH
jgi:transcriptional regulator GlxA family with amidase domain